MDIFRQLQQELERREEGFSPFEQPDLSALERKALGLFVRHRHLNLIELSHMLEVDQAIVRSTVERFVAQGLLLAFQLEGEKRYRPLFFEKQAQESRTDIWEAIKSLQNQDAKANRPPAAG